jgi:ATP/ADP translocase
MTELNLIKIIARTKMREEIFIFFLLYYFLFAQYLYADQTMYHVSKGIDITPWQSCLDSTIASAAPSPA